MVIELMVQVSWRRHLLVVSAYCELKIRLLFCCWISINKLNDARALALNCALVAYRSGQKCLRSL